MSLKTISDGGRGVYTGGMLMLMWCALVGGEPLPAAPPANQNRPAAPVIRKRGTIDCDLVETTPFVFRGRLYRFESVRTRYSANKTGKPYFRMVDTKTGDATPPFAEGHDLGSAFDHDDTVYVYGVHGWGTSTIHVFWSKDLRNWQSRPALTVPSWKIFNTSVCRAKDRFVMAFEVGAPKEVVGAGFTARFAESTDLIHWKLLPEDRVFTKSHYSACPTIRFVDGHYYVIYLHSVGGTWESRIVRSRNLVDWETSPLNPVLKYSDEDRRIASGRLTLAERRRIAKAVNRNNSDLDLCEFDGKVVIYYSWGNQHGVEHLAEAVYDGTLAELLKAYFP